MGGGWALGSWLSEVTRAVSLKEGILGPCSSSSSSCALCRTVAYYRLLLVKVTVDRQQVWLCFRNSGAYKRRSDSNEQVSAIPVTVECCVHSVNFALCPLTGFLDPEKKLFSHRILSRDECIDPYSKTGNLRYVLG